MLNAVIIVLRESLEASLLVSFLFVYSSLFAVKKDWMLPALIFGLGIGGIIASEIANLSALFGGFGQEILFAMVLILLSLLIQWINFMVFSASLIQPNRRRLKMLFSTIMVFAISLEGAEIIIFFESRFIDQESFYGALVGSLLGLGIGVSVGVISYYLLVQLAKSGLSVCILFLILISAGMASQAVSYLIQADLIESGYAVWDTNWLVEESSVTGQLLYSFIGYESTPILKQVIIYVIYLTVPLSLLFYLKNKKEP